MWEIKVSICLSHVMSLYPSPVFRQIIKYCCAILLNSDIFKHLFPIFLCIFLYFRKFFYILSTLFLLLAISTYYKFMHCFKYIFQLFRIFLLLQTLKILKYVWYLYFPGFSKCCKTLSSVRDTENFMQ